jgi:hypothetical protein
MREKSVKIWALISDDLVRDKECGGRGTHAISTLSGMSESWPEDENLAVKEMGLDCLHFPDLCRRLRHHVLNPIWNLIHVLMKDTDLFQTLPYTFWIYQCKLLDLNYLVAMGVNDNL